MAMKKIQFIINRDPDKKDPLGVEYWVYEEVIGVVERGNYIIIRMQESRAIIPILWVVSVKEF